MCLQLLLIVALIHQQDSQTSDCDETITADVTHPGSHLQALATKDAEATKLRQQADAVRGMLIEKDVVSTTLCCWLTT